MCPDAAGLLLIGYGNPGRLDDGLGPALAEAIEALHLPGVAVEANYQLTVEDAAELANHRIVVFADADVAGPEPFWVRRLEPSAGGLTFSTHSVKPADVLALGRQLFGAEPEAYVLGIRGYEFNEFGERLSDKARANLDAAIRYVEEAVQTGTFQEVRPDGGQTDEPQATGEDDSCRMEST
ncbi:hydrogenase maturation protease [Planctomycetota bacterium]